MFPASLLLIGLPGKISRDLDCKCKATCITQSSWEELSRKIILLPKHAIADCLGWDGNLACDLSLLFPINALLPEEHQLGLLQDGAVTQNQNERDR